MSSIFEREPGVWCGPNIRCANAENGKWIDGLNTFVETWDRQGFVHKENYAALFLTTTTTTPLPDSEESTQAQNQPN